VICPAAVRSADDEMEYTTSEIAAILGLTPEQVRAHARSGYVEPTRGPRGEYHFSFQDLVLLRTAVELMESQIPVRRIRRSLERLRDQLPAGRPLTAVRIAAEGDRVVVQDGDEAWSPESGQYVFNFRVADLAARVAPMARRAAEEARERQALMSADEWYELGCDVEIGSPDDAIEAYTHALELDATHAEAHVNLGRLLHERGKLAEAEKHYRAAVESDTESPVAAYNLGVVLEDAGRYRDAILAYRRAIEIDERFADAHYNIAQLYERLGEKADAFRHLKQFRNLMKE
jgi:tetratricopeptide (TPR) repeat protein